MKVIVYYCECSDEYLSKYFDALLKCMSDKTQDEIRRFKRNKDRYQRLISKMLLSYVFMENNLGINLEDIENNRFGRPTLKNNCDFNISHSGNYVVCAFSDRLRVGIDIEFMRNINLYRLKKIMSNEQWDDIINHDEPIKRFFHYWTLKESVLKADGRGLRGNLTDIKTLYDDKVFLDGKSWQVKPLSIHNDYACHLTHEQYDNVTIHIKKIEISDLSPLKN